MDVRPSISSWISPAKRVCATVFAGCQSFLGIEFGLAEIARLRGVRKFSLLPQTARAQNSESSKLGRNESSFQDIDTVFDPDLPDYSSQFHRDDTVSVSVLRKPVGVSPVLAEPTRLRRTPALNEAGYPCLATMARRVRRCTFVVERSNSVVGAGSEFSCWECGVSNAPGRPG
jgi:hypothetical protein